MRRERLNQVSLIHIAFVAMVCAIGVLISGCGEEVENPIGTEGAMGTLGTLKVPDTAPGAPSLEIPEGTPTVKSVGYYSDWQLTKPLTGTVSEGKTIFIKVEFSEGMKLVVADDKHARPILYRRINGKLIRFNIANFGAKGEDFVSGDAKPVKTKASFICKYIVQPEDTGEFVFAIGKWSVDLEGNSLPAFYTHKEKLQLGKPSSPTVKSVDYYSNWQLTKPLTGTIPSGTLVYTKVVFSEEMEHKVSDGAAARPELYYRIGNRDVQHNIVPLGASGRQYVDGDTKPAKIQTTYVGKYRIKSSNYGEFTLVVGTESANKKGVKVAEEYVHTEVLRAPEPPAPTVTITGAPTGVDNANVVRVTVRGQGATHYKYSVNAGEACGEYGNPTSISRRITANVSRLPDGTVTLCVLGKNAAGVWQTEPTTVQWTRDSSVVPKLPDPPETTRNETRDIPTITDNTPEAVPIAPLGAQDFSGFVYIPSQITGTTYYPYRSRGSPVANATVTALSGSVSGKKVVTDQNGQYIFRNVGGDALHLRVEKEGFEPKEVMAYRSRPTTLASGAKTNFPGDIQNTPGNILVGHRWPDTARRALNKLTVVHDLLYIDARGSPNPIEGQGRYGDGIIWVFEYYNEITFQALLVHEIMHAHQNAMVSIDGSGSPSSWTGTAEGRAFAAAMQKDRAEVGDHWFLDQDPYFRNNLLENAAQFYAFYWLSLPHITRQQAPNRFKWADTWLPR